MAERSFFEICIHRPIMTSMMSLALIIFGAIGLSRLPVRELPDVDPPVVSVTTIYPGASAEVVETEVTEILEDAIASSESIKILSSTSREETSSITIEFLLSRNVDLAAQDVRDRVARVRGELPDDVDEPIVKKQDSSGGAIIWASLISETLSPQELTRVADDVIKDRLQSLPGVSSVIIAGEKRCQGSLSRITVKDRCQGSLSRTLSRIAVNRV